MKSCTDAFVAFLPQKSAMSSQWLWTNCRIHAFLWSWKVLGLKHLDIPGDTLTIDLQIVKGSNMMGQWCINCISPMYSATSASDTGWTSRSGISQHMPAIHGTKTACLSTQLIKKQHWQHPPKTSWTWLLAWLMSRKDSKPWKWPSPYALCRPTYCYIKFTLCICAILTSERSN